MPNNPNRELLKLPHKFKSYELAKFTAALLAIGVFSWYAYQLILSYNPPSEYLSVYAEPPIVREGDPLYITYRINRHRFCPTYLHQFVLRDSKDEHVSLPVWSNVRLGGVTGLGVNVAIHEIDYTRLLKPGDYLFRGCANPKCPEGEHYFCHTDLKFQVVPKD